MNEQAASLAAINISLLQAIHAGPAESRQALAEAAQVVVNNLNRKLDSLLEAGLIAKTGDASHEVALTEIGVRALGMMDYWRGNSGPAPALDGESLIYVPFDQIEPWALNPRTQFNEASIEDMAQSIADKGVLQPLTVRRKGNGYEVIIGERRRRGAHLAAARNWVSFDFLVPCQVRDWNDDEALDVAGVENLQREDLHWMDEAKFYLRLADRGRSAAEIVRLAGADRSKRHVQTYCQVARELSPEDIARAYLPDGHKDQLLYVRARDLVGEKKEKPALDLSPKLALTLLEMIHAAPAPETAGPLTVTFHKAPSGGPISTLSERKLIAWKFVGATPAAVITITDDIKRWLDQLGYFANPNRVVHKARELVLGELQANSLRPGEYVTAELNPPRAAPLAPPAAAELDLSPSQRRIFREIAARSLHRHRLLDGWVKADATALDDADYQALYDLEYTMHQARPDGFSIALTLRGRDLLKSTGHAPDDGKSANSCATSWLRTDAPADDGDDGDRLNEAGQADESLALEPTPARPPQPSLPEPKPLPAMLAIVLIEAAHKVSAEGVERGEGTWGAPILADHYKDTRGSALVQEWRMLAFFPMGQKTLVVVTKRGQDWLADTLHVPSDNGRPTMGDGALIGFQRDMGFEPKAGAYSTPWLNDPVAEAAPVSLGPPPLGEVAAQPPEGASDLAARLEADPPAYLQRLAGVQQPSIAEPTAEQRLLAALDGALRQAGEFIDRLPAKTKAPTRAEVEQILALIASARDRAAAHLPEQA